MSLQGRGLTPTSRMTVAVTSRMTVPCKALGGYLSNAVVADIAEQDFECIG